MSGEGGALVAALVSMGGLALLAPVLDRRLGRDTGYALAVGFLGVAALLAPAASTALDDGAVTFSRTWIDSLGVSFTLRMDGLATLFCVLVLGVGALIMAYCPRYLRAGEAHGRTYLLLTLFGGAMLGLVLAGDLLLLFVFWEVTTVTSFFLIGTGGPKAAKPAVRALLVTGMGGLALLAALVLLGIAAGSTDLADVLAAREEVLDSPLSPAIATLLVLAAFTKSAQVPFQFWLPGAMAAITPVSAYLHAATMVKAGIYLLLRFSALYSGQTGWVIALMGVGLLTAVLGAAQALREHDLKALLAYSTVSQLGLLVAAIGVGTTVALAAAILHTFAHALFKATLFMIVGVIDRQAGSRDIRELSGLMRVMPVTATMAGLAGLSMAGVPPLIGFVSKESLFQGFVSADVFPGAGVVAGALAVTASVLTFAYGMRIFYGAFAGPLRQRLHEPSWAFVAPAAVAAAAGAVLGPGVEVLDPLMRQAVLDAEPWAVPPYFVFWHGFSPELLLSAVTIVSGLALFSARERVDRMLRRLPRPDGAAVFDRVYSTVLDAGAAVGRPDHSDSAAAFLARPLAGLVALGCAGVFAAGGPGIRAGAPSGALDWGVLVLLAAAVAALVRTGSALAAVALLGAVGLTVAVWFLLAGAPDVALTLLLVEVLTAMAAAFVLSDLSPRFPRPGGGGALAAALAGLVGLVAVLGTLALTGRRDLSPAGAYFLRAAEPETGGRNVVNTILVDFRGLDTLGEASVLAAAALGLLLLLPGPPPGAAGGRPEAPYGRLLAPARRLLVPGIAALSAYLFLRGHNQPGGGFSAALVAGAAVAFGHLAGRTGTRGARFLRPRPLLAAGLLLGAAVGLAAMALGDPFLTPFTVPVPGGGLSSALLFDAAVYLMVLGLVVALVDRLGAGGMGHR
ncbi:hydrogen gas-evolving membrane-bound hydrogenase subunit E [Streptomyces sp. DH37]|uniref:hydrogen gas-evolving membrane-bound hydrogenase subunit E n=1 Tax=Streptomyces sp. DH37 TaxID=3040122 RepID=UPI002442CD35|nr:hydrogen gas-evolving membrane-bound hydrogenase subunit E [Streptomyces sp. DH37]MDG9702829.1 proton-conducting transporter membrane subunit [Streptomyces sp. DH37]